MHFIQINSKQECKNSKLYITTKKYIHVPYLKYSQLCHIIKSYITMPLLQLFSLFPYNTCPVQCKWYCFMVGKQTLGITSEIYCYHLRMIRIF